MSDKRKPITVQVKRRFNASCERVFDAWLDPRLAKQFLFATDTGTVVQCDIDARVGGKFTIVDRRPRDDGSPGTQDTLHTGAYLEVDRPRRLVFTFAVPQYSEESTTVALDIVAQDDGCELTLTHDMGTSDVARQWRDRTEEGWGKILDAASRALQKGG